MPLQPRGSRIPVYGIGGHTGDFFAYQDFVRHLGEEQPFYGLHPPGLDERSRRLESVEALATYFAAQIRAFQAAGPCIIAGYCAGGACALELARQLAASGTEVRFVALFGCPHPTLYRFSPGYWARRIAGHARVLATLPTFREQREYVVARVRARLQALRDERTPPGEDLVSRLKFEFGHATIAALKRHAPAALRRPRVPVPAQPRVVSRRRRRAALARGGAARRGLLRARQRRSRPHARRPARGRVRRALQHRMPQRRGGSRRCVPQPSREDDLL